MGRSLAFQPWRLQASGMHFSVAAPLLALIVQPPPPPIVTTAPNPIPALTAYRAGEARCGGTAQKPLLTEAPLPTGTFVAPGEVLKPLPIKLGFRIDATGRPLSIKAPIGGAYGPDVPAAFAAWRFAPGAERSDCEIEFAPVTAPVSTADLATVHRYLALLGAQRQGPHPAVGRAAFERAKPPGDCLDPPPNVRLRAYPAFEAIPQPPGTMSYSFLQFDIDSKGRPTNIRVVTSDGNAALDRQSADAIARSRFEPAARRGCNYPYYRRQPEPMKAPEAPSADAFRPEAATCPKEQGPWASMPKLTFPPEFGRRAIEGWAVIGYDLAPWGATGNVRVLASEPADAFGLQAVRIVAQARRAPAASGYAGCTTLVRFVLPLRGGAREGTETGSGEGD